MSDLIFISSKKNYLPLVRLTIGGNIVFIIFYFAAYSYALMEAVPNLAFQNAMACFVFRQIKFGLITADGTSQIDTSVVAKMIFRDNSKITSTTNADVEANTISRATGRIAIDAPTESFVLNESETQSMIDMRKSDPVCQLSLAHPSYSNR